MSWATWKTLQPEPGSVDINDDDDYGGNDDSSGSLIVTQT